MSGTRRAIGLASIAIVLACPVVTAHRLDEYLQAARISLAPDRVVLELDLTPGVEVAPMIFASINTNRDGRISSREGRAYADRILKDVVLELDGRRQDLTLVASTFPSFEEMTAGVGVIRLEARAAGPAATPGRHSLFLQNNHRADISVYLVNALRPAGAEVDITEQRRDPRQHEIRLDFTVAGGAGRSGWPPALAILVLTIVILPTTVLRCRRG